MNPEIISTSTEEYKELIESLKKDGFEMMVDLTVVDWFRKKEPRFEIVVQFLSTSKNSRKTVKVFVNDEEKYTLYFYRGRYRQKYCFKKMDKEVVTKEVLDCYRLLSNFKFIKLHNF